MSKPAKTRFLALASFLFFIFCAPATLAQCNYTTVSATVVDPSGVPYAFAKVTATLAPSPAGSPLCSGQPFSGIIGPVNTDSAGTFSILVPPNASITPASTTWQFTVGIAPGVAPPFGTGPQTFTVTGITVSGSTQSITGTLNAAALALTVPFGGGGGSGTVSPGAQYLIPLYPTAGTVATVGPSNIFTDSTKNNLSIPGSAFFGLNPWIDVTLPPYNVRAVSSLPTTTGNCHGNTTIDGVTVTNFQVGDGIVAYGCGATNAMSTPAAPTVTAAVARIGTNTGHVAPGLTGATSRTYIIAAIDESGGVTPGSTPTTLTTGAATLGAVGSCTATNYSLSGTTLTVTTSCDTGIASLGMVSIVGALPAKFDGVYGPATRIDSSHFSVATNYSSLTNSGVNSGTLGTVTVYNSDHLDWSATPVTGANQYVICDGSNNLLGISRPGEFTWDYYGQTAPPHPSYLATCPTVAINDYLQTTITAIGAGSFTTADPATQTVSGQTIKQDNEAPFLKAYNVAIGNSLPSTLHFPAVPAGMSYYFNSYLNAPGTGVPVLVDIEGPFTIAETMAYNGIVHLSGILGGSSRSCPGFVYDCGPLMNITTAFPGIQLNTPQGSVVDHLTMETGTNGFIMDASSSNGGFNFTLSYDNFLIPGTTDTTGLGLALNGISQVTGDHDSFSVNDSGAYGYSQSPFVYVRDSLNSTNGPGGMSCFHCYWVGRAITTDANPQVSSFAKFDLYDNYAQALRTPFITSGLITGPFYTVHSFNNDSSITPILSNLGASTMSVILEQVAAGGFDTGGAAPLVTGNPIVGFEATNIPSPSFAGPDTNAFSNLNYVFMSYPGNGTTSSTSVATLNNLYSMDAPFHMGPTYPIFWPLAPPANLAVNAAATSGGSVPVGAHVYSVTAVGIDTGETKSLPGVTCTVTTLGTQTCTPTWTASAGNLLFNVYRDGSGLAACRHLPASTLTCVDTAANASSGFLPLQTGTGSTTLSANSVITPQLVSTLLNQETASQFAGTGTMTGGTFSFTFPTAYNSAPACTANDTTSAAAVKVAVSATTLTLTGTSGDGASFICAGNPN